MRIAPGTNLRVRQLTQTTLGRCFQRAPMRAKGDVLGPYVRAQRIQAEYELAPLLRVARNAEERSTPKDLKRHREFLEVGEEIDGVAVGILDFGIAHPPERIPGLLVAVAAGVQEPPIRFVDLRR